MGVLREDLVAGDAAGIGVEYFEFVFEVRT